MINCPVYLDASTGHASNATLQKQTKIPYIFTKHILTNNKSNKMNSQTNAKTAYSQQKEKHT